MPNTKLESNNVNDSRLKQVLVNKLIVADIHPKKRLRMVLTLKPRVGNPDR